MLKNIFSTSITKKRASDTGMAIILILLIIAMLTENNIYLIVAIPVLIINMIFPNFYFPFAVVWFGLSHLLGTFVSKIILTIVFIMMVLPVSLLRRFLKKRFASIERI